MKTCRKGIPARVKKLRDGKYAIRATYAISLMVRLHQSKRAGDNLWFV